MAGLAGSALLPLGVATLIVAPTRNTRGGGDLEQKLDAWMRVFTYTTYCVAQ
jgi:hypothetical protein